MKTVILAGGRGSRISEESVIRPKPMIEIGSRPILWHIMKTYAHYGYEDFIICCGYKGQMIKEYFINYYINSSDVTFRLDEHRAESKGAHSENWKVTLANTGLNTLTAGRILKIKQYTGDDEEFMLTYGDGVADVDIDALVRFHRENGCVATVTVTRPPGRFGVLHIDEDMKVRGFKEKARMDSGLVNAGFMVLNKQIFDYLGDGSEMLEAGPFERLAADGQMAAYEHKGFWSPMDTMRDKEYLEGLWMSGDAPWKV